MFDFDAFNRGRIAHGVLTSLAVILFFPIGGVLLRLLKGPNIVKVHIALQIIGLAVLIAGFGLGIWVQEQIKIVSLHHFNIPSGHRFLQHSDANEGHVKEYSDPHQKLGTILIVLFILMPIAGSFNHWRFRKTGKKTYIGYGHVWVGRIIIILSLINGGLGLKLAKEGSGGKIAYAVLAAVAAITYAGVLAWWYTFGRKSAKTSEPAAIELNSSATPAA